MLLDFGAIGKGYLIDIVGGIISDFGVRHYMVDAGGDILVRTSEPVRIALENPSNFSEAVGVAQISNGSICGSAGNRRKWDRFHHIINPETIESPRHILGLWTVADSTLLADAISTALYFAEPEKLLQYFNFEFVIVYPGNRLKASSGFPGQLFS